MANFITRCELSINGATEKNFKSFTEKATTHGISVNLMNETGYAKKTQRWQVEVDYVVPQVNPRDFSTLANGTLTVEYNGGERHNYGGVNLLEVGDSTIDGDNEKIQKVTLLCETRDGLKGSE